MESTRAFKYALAGVAAIYCVYLVQIFSPLRLNYDVIVYLTMASSVADGESLSTHTIAKLPSGYPLLLGGLDVVGLGHSSAFIALNCFLLALGLWASYHLFIRAFGQPRETALLLCAMTLLCYGVQKYTALAMSEIAFFAAVSGCALMLVLLEQELDHKGRYAALVLATFVIALSFRIAAVALAPAIVYALRPSFERARIGLARTFTRPVALSALAAGALLLAGTGVVLADNVRKYLVEGKAIYHRIGVLELALWNLWAKAVEWGELVSNVHYPAIPSSLQVLRLTQMLIGVVAFGMFIHILWGRRRRLSAVDVLVLSYTAMLIVWPGLGIRFWIPILPLLIGYFVVHLQAWGRTRHRRVAVYAYLVWFAVTGAVALAQNTRITFSRAVFAEVYEGGLMEEVYRNAFQDVRPAQGELIHIQEKGIRALERYEPERAAW